MYYRIFHVSSAFRYQLFLSAALVTGWWAGCTVATLTNCIPLEWSWINGLADPRYCFNYNVFWMAAGVCEIFLDVLILTLPISVLTRLRLSWRRKLTISGIFLLGGLYVATRATLCAPFPLRLTTASDSVVITGVVKVVLGYPPGSRVPSYSNTEVWTTVHTGIAIVCSSLPFFHPLVDRIIKSPLAVQASTLMSKAGMKMGLRPYFTLRQKDISGSDGADSWERNGGTGPKPFAVLRRKMIDPDTSLLETAHTEEDIAIA